MLIDTRALLAAIAERFEAMAVTADEVASDAAAFEALTRQEHQEAELKRGILELERTAERYLGPDIGRLYQLLNRVYAFLCAYTGDGNPTGVDLEHPLNTPDALRGELERRLPDILKHHGVTLENLHGHGYYSYWRMSADAYEHDNDHAPEDELTKAELYGRLEGHVKDVGVAVRDLEANPGVWHRLTDFAFYRAVYHYPAVEINFTVRPKAGEGLEP